jgi:lysophospholipid acyltransferase (LPLAT)-like uncharacterized protein
MKPLPRHGPVHTIAGWRHLVLWPLALLVRLWGASLRFRHSPESQRVLDNDFDPRVPSLFILWHNRLFLVPQFVRRYAAGQPIHALVSSSKDGAWLVALFDLLGLRAIRGSSSRHGREAVTELIATLNAGLHCGITPDGPRGPRYSFKPGALVVARRANVRIVCLGAAFRGPVLRLKSWDRLAIPLPFTRVDFALRILPANTLADASTDSLRRHLLLLNPDSQPRKKLRAHPPNSATSV